MNKQIKKLILSRETLLKLSESDLQRVVGGVTRALSCGCEYTDYSCTAPCPSAAVC
jgi:natural product precursor